MDLDGFSKPQYVVASTPWKEVNGSKAEFSKITESKVFVLQYELAEDVEPVVITVDEIENKFAYNQVVTITSELEDFSHWEEDGVIVSYDREYKFTALVNRNLVAKTDSTPKPLISLINATGIKEGYKSFLGQFYLPNGYKLIEAGVLASNEEKVLFLDSDNTTVVKSTSILESTNEFLRSFPEDSFTTFRGYMVVKHESNIEVVYSENNFYSSSESLANEYIEKFDNVTTSSSYNDEQDYVDENGFFWSLRGRGDQSLDGKAWTLGNKGDNSFIQVIATGGISSFTVDLVRAFGNSNKRTVELFVNEISFGTFEVDTGSDNKQIFTVNNINISGEVKIKLVSINTGDRGATIVDNFSWIGLSSNSTETKLYGVELIVDEETTYKYVREGNKLHQPLNPSKMGYTFEGWFTEPEFNHEFNFDSEINNHLKLYAKFVETPIPTIAEARALDKGDEVTTKGVVTALIGKNAFIQDETGGIYLYLGGNSDYAEILVVGNEVKVVGKMDNYNNLIQISPIENIELLKEDQELPESVVFTDLVLEDIIAEQGKLITINDLIIKTIPTIGTGAYSVVVTDGTVDLEIRVDKNISTFADIKALFEGAIVGQRINLVNIPVGQFNAKPQVMPSLVSQLVLQPLTPELIESIIKKEIDPGTDLIVDVELKTTVNINGAEYTVTWTSNNTDVITNDGKVTRPSATSGDITVKLTAVVTDSNDAEIRRFEYNVIVLAQPEEVFKDLFISEYGEGSSNNKWIELYNPTDTAIDLSNYAIKVYYNGNTTSNSTTTLSGALAPGATYVVAYNQASSDIKAKAQTTSANINFNGDDAVVLTKNNEIIDIIGVIGERNNIFADKTLIRIPAVVSPNAKYNASEWEEKSNDYIGNLGVHTINP